MGNQTPVESETSPALQVPPMYSCTGAAPGNFSISVWTVMVGEALLLQLPSFSALTAVRL